MLKLFIASVNVQLNAGKSISLITSHVYVLYVLIQIIETDINKTVRIKKAGLHC